MRSHSRDRQSSFSSAGSHYSAGSSIFSHSSSRSTSTRMSVPNVDVAHYAAAGNLPCEFVGYGGCDHVFRLEDTEAWIEHVIVDHLDNKLPKVVVCWFCDDYTFDSKRTGDRRVNFDQRMYHIREHFLTEGRTTHQMRPDHYFNSHLQSSGLISDQSYNSVRRYNEVPQPSWILAHDAVPPDWQMRDPRSELEYQNPHDEARQYRRHRHKSGKSRK